MGRKPSQVTAPSSSTKDGIVGARTAEYGSPNYHSGSDTRFDVYPFDSDPPEVKTNYERLQMRTTAHEMGHLIIQYGHPDEGGGAAPLPGTNHNERLMRSGGSGKILRGNRLVKGEWDAAEEWFKNRPNGDR